VLDRLKGQQVVSIVSTTSQFWERSDLQKLSQQPWHEMKVTCDTKWQSQ
jgi:hypothetical protein